MAKESTAQATQNDGAAAAKVAGLGPQSQPQQAAPSPAPAPTPAPQVAIATDQFTPLQLRALDDNGGHLAREFAMGAAKLCESPQVLPKTKERARRLLRLALAALE